MQHLTPPDLAAWLADTSRTRPLLLDVREPWEVSTASIAGATHIPMREIPGRKAELPADAEIVCVCHHGARSAQVCQFLEAQGFGKMHNLTGGIDAWARQVDPTVGVY